MVDKESGFLREMLSELKGCEKRWVCTLASVIQKSSENLPGFLWEFFCGHVPTVFQDFQAGIRELIGEMFSNPKGHDTVLSSPQNQRGHIKLFEPRGHLP